MDTQIDYSAHPFSPEGGRMCWYYTHYLIIAQYMHDEPDWPLGRGVALGAQRAHEVKWFFIRDEAEYAKVFDRFLEHPETLRELEAYMRRIQEESLAYMRKCDAAALTDTGLSAALKQHDLFFTRHLRVASILRHVDRGLVAAVRTHYPDAQEADALLEKISVIQRPSFALREEMAIAAAARAIEAGDRAQEAAIDDLLASFAWAGLGYYDEPARTRDYYEAHLAAPHTDDLAARFEAEARAREAYVATLDERMRRIAAIASESAYLKDCFKFGINEFQYESEKLFVETARRIGMDVRALKDLSPEEVRTVLAGEAIDQALVQERTQHNVLACDAGIRMEQFAGAQADEFEREYLRFDHGGTSEWKGRVACRGFARGRAAIITGSGAFGKMRQGDILVAINTSPDYVPVMRKAAAIVAEEGGITAHVSVVSREMGIPCIVGIRDITRALKDGDLVEVDAEKGVVRILEMI